MVFQGDNRPKTIRRCKVCEMRNTSVLSVATFVAAIAVSVAAPAQARHLRPAVPPEIGVRQLAAGWAPYRCSEEPVLNFYHGAWYDAPPAIWQGYAYRPYYRYTAWRAIPRTYFCAER
jgi:hypothetical protein